jgi:MYXO-CTERM domain-containing protein
MRVLAALVLCAGSASAFAAPIEIRDAGDGSLRARQPVAPTSAAAHARSRTLYLNRAGGTLTPGANNSQANTSSLVDQASTIAGWDVDDAMWAATMSCVRAMWAPFDVDITDADPGTTPHVEVHIGGSPTSIGFPPKIGGVAPMALDCSIVEHSIVFVFPVNLRDDPQIVCEVVAQEVGHSFGLDHELEPADPMTYLSYAGERTFQDRTVACGETTARPCGINGSYCRANQNSYQLLLDRLGAPGSDHDAPTLDVVAPRDGSVVEPGFSVIANASDDVEVAQITLHLDGALVATDRTSLDFAIAPGLPPGPHTLVIEVADTAGNTTNRQLAVHLEPEAAPADPADDPVPMLGCSTGGDPGVVLGVFMFLAYRRRRRDIGR